MQKKVFISFLLLLIVISPTLSKISVWIYFLSNRSEIAKTKCIYKDIPDSCCKGKCYLSTQLKKTDSPFQDKNPTIPNALKLKEFPAELFKVIFFKSTETYLSTIKRIFLENSYSYKFAFSIFHPPEV